ncbi:DNA polymerase delta subunit, OB-fold domain [Dillenia turbinata]|uniref:DNA polymerase delta subunit, OB-fold domain n=1 Tax=Dillenia turbinata TaxID=194707 RepID=A0AAN8VVY5_9MAGN
MVVRLHRITSAFLLFPFIRYSRQNSFPAMGALEIEADNTHLQRKRALYDSLDEKFEIQKETYRGQQYSQIYFARLHHMRTLLYSLLPNWIPHPPVCTVLGLEEAKECIIVGTLYKHMKLKPTILDEYSKERSVVPLVKPHNFMQPDDHLVLEDESGRVKLGGTVILPSKYVRRRQICCFVSGIRVGSNMSNPLQFQLLVDHITGHLGDVKVKLRIEQERSIAVQIVHVVIAGNSVEIPNGLLNGQNLGSKEQSTLSLPIKELDILLTQIVAGLSVDIMPGPADPANFSLPQQPLHGCLFPGSSAYKTFRSCTNPHSFDLDDIRFLETSGQNIDDLVKYSEATYKLEFMERTLRWRHLAPTAPNTLGCYPFIDRDPFLLDTCPHVYFNGNQNRYKTRLLTGPEGRSVRLISIPNFCEAGVAVVLNMRNLECHALSFGTQFGT